MNLCEKISFNDGLSGRKFGDMKELCRSEVEELSTTNSHLQVDHSIDTPRDAGLSISIPSDMSPTLGSDFEHLNYSNLLMTSSLTPVSPVSTEENHPDNTSFNEPSKFPLLSVAHVGQVDDITGPKCTPSEQQLPAEVKLEEPKTKYIPVDMSSRSFQRSSEDVGHNQGASVDIGHKERSFEDIGHKEGAPEDIGHKEGASKDIVHKERSSKDIGHEQRSSEVIGHEQRSSKDIGHKEGASKDIGHEQRSSEDIGHRPFSNQSSPVNKPAVIGESLNNINEQHSSPSHSQAGLSKPSNDKGSQKPQNMKSLESPDNNEKKDKNEELSAIKYDWKDFGPLYLLELGCHSSRTIPNLMKLYSHRKRIFKNSDSNFEVKIPGVLISSETCDQQCKTPNLQSVAASKSSLPIQHKFAASYPSLFPISDPHSSAYSPTNAFPISPNVGVYPNNATTFHNASLSHCNFTKSSDAMSSTSAKVSAQDSSYASKIVPSTSDGTNGFSPGRKQIEGSSNNLNGLSPNHHAYSPGAGKFSPHTYRNENCSLGNSMSLSPGVPKIMSPVARKPFSPVGHEIPKQDSNVNHRNCSPFIPNAISPGISKMASPKTPKLASHATHDVISIASPNGPETRTLKTLSPSKQNVSLQVPTVMSQGIPKIPSEKMPSPSTGKTISPKTKTLYSPDVPIIASHSTTKTTSAITNNLSPRSTQLPTSSTYGNCPSSVLHSPVLPDAFSHPNFSSNFLHLNDSKTPKRSEQETNKLFNSKPKGGSSDDNNTFGKTSISSGLHQATSAADNLLPLMALPPLWSPLPPHNPPVPPPPFPPLWLHPALGVSSNSTTQFGCHVTRDPVTGEFCFLPKSSQIPDSMAPDLLWAGYHQVNTTSYLMNPQLLLNHPHYHNQLLSPNSSLLHLQSVLSSPHYIDQHLSKSNDALTDDVKPSLMQSPLEKSSSLSLPSLPQANVAPHPPPPLFCPSKSFPFWYSPYANLSPFPLERFPPPSSEPVKFGKELSVNTSQKEPVLSKGRRSSDNCKSTLKVSPKPTHVQTQPSPNLTSKNLYSPSLPKTSYLTPQKEVLKPTSPDLTDSPVDLSCQKHSGYNYKLPSCKTSPRESPKTIDNIKKEHDKSSFSSRFQSEDGVEVSSFCDSHNSVVKSEVIYSNSSEFDSKPPKKNVVLKVGDNFLSKNSHELRSKEQKFKTISSQSSDFNKKEESNRENINEPSSTIRERSNKIDSSGLDLLLQTFIQHGDRLAMNTDKVPSVKNDVTAPNLNRSYSVTSIADSHKPTLNGTSFTSSSLNSLSTPSNSNASVAKCASKKDCFSVLCALAEQRILEEEQSEDEKNYGLISLSELAASIPFVPTSNESASNSTCENATISSGSNLSGNSSVPTYLEDINYEKQISPGKLSANMKRFTDINCNYESSEREGALNMLPKYSSLNHQSAVTISSRNTENLESSELKKQEQVNGIGHKPPLNNVNEPLDKLQQKSSPFKTEKSNQTKTKICNFPTIRNLNGTPNTCPLNKDGHKTNQNGVGGNSQSDALQRVNNKNYLNRDYYNDNDNYPYHHKRFSMTSPRRDTKNYPSKHLLMKSFVDEDASHDECSLLSAVSSQKRKPGRPRKYFPIKYDSTEPVCKNRRSPGFFMVSQKPKIRPKLKAELKVRQAECEDDVSSSNEEPKDPDLYWNPYPSSEGKVDHLISPTNSPANYRAKKQKGVNRGTKVLRKSLTKNKTNRQSDFEQDSHMQELFRSLKRSSTVAALEHDESEDEKEDRTDCLSTEVDRTCGSQKEDTKSVKLFPESHNQSISYSLQVKDLVSGARILVLQDGLLYPGSLVPISPPDVYCVHMDGQRGTKQHIYCQEELLNQAWKEIKPGSTRFLSNGTRVCAFWSHQYRGLYAGVVTTLSSCYPLDGNPNLVHVEFDDGDSGKIHVDDIRLLPPEFPVIEHDPNPLMTLQKRKRRSTEDDLSSSTREEVMSESKCTPVDNQEPKYTLSKSVTEQPTVVSTTPEIPKFKLKVTSPAHLSEISQNEPKKIKLESDESLLMAQVGLQSNSSPILNGSDVDSTSVLPRKHKHKRKHKKHRDKHASPEAFPRVEQGDSVLRMRIKSPSRTSILSDTCSSPQPIQTEDLFRTITPPLYKTIDKSPQPIKKRKKGEKSKMAPFLLKRQLWKWSGKSYRKPGSKGKGKKEFYKEIVRGKEHIRVGDCAVFLSSGSHERPFIGMIDFLWESWGGNMVVKVRWFYHPDETIGIEKTLTEPKGALFSSSHTDENDVQTISHKCNVVPLADYRLRRADLDRKHGADFDNHDLFYLAGHYDTTCARITMEPGVS